MFRTLTLALFVRSGQCSMTSVPADRQLAEIVDDLDTEYVYDDEVDMIVSGDFLHTIEENSNETNVRPGPISVTTFLQLDLPFIEEPRMMATALRNAELDFNIRLPPDHRTLLHETVRKCRISILQLLLSSNERVVIDVNAREQRHGFTSLHFAVLPLILNPNLGQSHEYFPQKCDGRVEMTEILLKRGAKINIVDWEFGETPLHIAARSPRGDQDSRKLVELFIQWGKVDDVIIQSSHEFVTALHSLVHYYPVEVSKTLLDKVKNECAPDVLHRFVNSKTRCGWTALHIATYYGHISHAELLLQYGAKTDEMNNLNHNALELMRLNPVFQKDTSGMYSRMNKLFADHQKKTKKKRALAPAPTVKKSRKKSRKNKQKGRKKLRQINNNPPSL